MDEFKKFLDAQEGVFATAMAELRAGEKRSHWMWFIFPQLAGLGFSEMAHRYAIRDIAQARAYLAHPILGPRLLQATETVLAVKGRTAAEIFGYPDDLKLRSCATLFAQVRAPGSSFHQLLAVYFGGQTDARTLDKLGAAPDNGRQGGA